MCAKTGSPRLPLRGRRGELALLADLASRCAAGSGSTAFILGERGIGKTRLVEAFKEHGSVAGFTLLCGTASRDSSRPFEVFSAALPEFKGIHSDAESSSFTHVFVVNAHGRVVARVPPSSDGADALATSLQAVQQFIRDSIGRAEGGGRLGMLEFGEVKVLVEETGGVFVAGVFSGARHGGMSILLRDALERIVREHGVAVAGSEGSECVPVSAILEPLLQHRFLAKRDLEGVKLSNERAKMADAVLKLLAGKAAERPVALVLEDIQWTDDSSRFILEYLARNIREKRILMVCTVRSGEDERVEKQIKTLADENLSQTIRIEGIAGEDFSGLISDLASPTSSDRNRRILEVCKGNPLFAMEIVRQLAEQADGAPLPVPGSLSEVVQARLARLEPGALTLCECASCVGRVFETAAVASQEFVPDPEASFARAEERSIVAKGAPNSEFLHAIYPEIIYRDIGQRWKAAYHRALGVYFEKVHAGDVEPVIYELAKHFSRCGDDARASRYCILAGEKAERVFAVSDAIGYYQTAVSALERQDGPKARFEAAETVERLGDLLTMVGRMKEADEALARALEAAAPGEDAARIHRKRSIAIMKLGDNDGALAEADAGMALVPDDCVERQRLAIQKGNIWMLTGRFDEAIAVASDALRTLSGTRAVDTELGNCHNVLGTCHWYRGEFDVALDHHMKALAHRVAAGNGRRIALSHNNIGLVYHKRGDLSKAREYYERSMVEWEKTGDRDGMTAAYGNIGILRWDAGDLPGALELFRKAAAITEAMGDRQGMATAYGNIAMTLGDTGDAKGSLEYGRKCREMAQRSGDRIVENMSKVNDAKTLVFIGDHDTARKFLLEAESVFDASGAADLLATARIVLADVAVEDGDLDKARGHIAAIGQQEGNADLELVKGKLAMAAGDYGGAEAYVDSARRLIGEQGSRRSIPEALYLMGELRAKQGDGTGAAGFYAQAKGMFEEMSMAAWAGRCAEKLREPGRE